MGSTRKSFLILLFSSNFLAIVQFIVSLAMARLLTPHDFGVFSVTAILVGIVQIIREMGANSYLIQVKELNNEMIRAALGVSILMSWTVASLLFLNAGHIADFYREPGVIEVIHILCINFLVIPFGSNTVALLRRQMRFGLLSRIDIIANLGGLATSLYLAARGCGYVSLAWGSSATVVISCFLSLLSRPRDLPWVPGWRGMGAVVRFGLPMVGTGLTSTAYLGLFELILSRTLGMQATALFSRAIGVPRLVGSLLFPAACALAFPYFSKLNREGMSAKPAFLTGVSYVTGVLWPLFALISCISEPLIVTLYGPQWLDSIPLISYLCVANGLGGAFVLFSSYINGIGRQKINFKISCLALFIRGVSILSLQSFGLVAVAAGVIAENLILSAVYLVFLKRLLSISICEYIRAIVPSILVATLVFLGVTATVKWIVLGDSTFSVIVVISATSAISWLISIRLLRHPLRNELSSYWEKVVSRVNPA